MIHYISLAMGWTLAVFMALLAFAILQRIFDGRIDLNNLISEKDGSGASLSRFQFLIFTYVIAMSLFLIVVSDDPPQFPKSIPGEILALLGISGSSYVVSKAVQNREDKRRKPPSTSTSANTPTPEDDS